MSVDGCLDAPGPERLVLSGHADLDRVDAERSEADAIMVGAGTIRRDNPRLVIRSAGRRASRVRRGLPENPARVTLTASGDLDPSARFFDATSGAGPVVYCAAPQAPRLQNMLNDIAPVIAVPPPMGLGAILADLSRRGVHRLLVEGGARLGREFLANGLVDELALAVAPFFVGAAAAPRFAGPGVYPHDPARPMHLAEVRQLDNVVLLRYLLGGDGRRARGEAWARQGRGDRDLRAGGFQGEPEARDRGGRDPETSGIPGRTVTAADPGAPGAGAAANAADRDWLAQAIDLSRRCPPSRAAYAVGAIIVAADGTVMATGYSRETSPHDHAEEAALAKIGPAGSPARRCHPLQLAGTVPGPCLPARPVCGAHHHRGPAPGGDRLAGAAGLRPRGRGRPAPRGRDYRGGGPRPGRRGARRQRRGPRRAGPGFMITDG